MKTFKQFLESKGITEDVFNAKSAEEMAALHKEYSESVSEEIKTAIANKASKEDVSELIKDAIAGITGYAKADEIKAIKDSLEEQGVELTKMKNKGGEGSTKSLSDEIIEKKEAILKVARGAAGEVEMKALTTRASVANSPAGFVLPDIGQLGVKERSLYNVLPKVTLGDGNHTGTVRYRDWDEATSVRAAAAVAEGAAFPESTAKFEWYTKPLRKIGDTLPVTEEFFEDEQQAAGELEMFLEVNVNTEIDDQLVNGDNTGQNLDGLVTTVPAYTAVNSGIASANLKDLAIKVRNTITRTRGSKYRPDMLVVSSSTMEDLVLAKDANNNYIFDETTGTVGGLMVVIDENMADNVIVVGDRRYARIYEKGGVNLSRGRVNNQFNEDEMTLKARKRMLLLIRTVDKTGFLKVADVDAALTTLAATPI